mmetsp:Transcript_73487/g.192745  ORF Transcript_73487/g.192745 Transcript_73487/m.192745 type:complete len:189 (+) Transcript_73487:64-630(+)
MGQVCVRDQDGCDGAVSGFSSVQVMSKHALTPLAVLIGANRGDLACLCGAAPHPQAGVEITEVFVASAEGHEARLAGRQLNEPMSPMEVANLEAIETSRINPWARQDEIHVDKEKVEAPTAYMADSVNGFEIVTARRDFLNTDYAEEDWIPSSEAMPCKTRPRQLSPRGYSRRTPRVGPQGRIPRSIP